MWYANFLYVYKNATREMCHIARADILYIDLKKKMYRYTQFFFIEKKIIKTQKKKKFWQVSAAPGAFIIVVVVARLYTLHVYARARATWMAFHLSYTHGGEESKKKDKKKEKICLEQVGKCLSKVHATMYAYKNERKTRLWHDDDANGWCWWWQ